MEDIEEELEEELLVLKLLEEKLGVIDDDDDDDDDDDNWYGGILDDEWAELMGGLVMLPGLFGMVPDDESCARPEAEANSNPSMQGR